MPTKSMNFASCANRSKRERRSSSRAGVSATSGASSSSSISPPDMGTSAASFTRSPTAQACVAASSISSAIILNSSSERLGETIWKKATISANVTFMSPSVSIASSCAKILVSWGPTAMCDFITARRSMDPSLLVSHVSNMPTTLSFRTSGSCGSSSSVSSRSSPTAEASGASTSRMHLTMVTTPSAASCISARMQSNSSLASVPAAVANHVSHSSWLM
mmetsp:Transcript_32603/g.55770  ORF Transcript_32603/g.55770 Transcript_32603/m.55770 type:complete len:219 (-) Transcript_32603:264-920(-)